ncbi:MAG: PD-(D/E)XK nuclease family protein [Oscillospiraceae bacterium]|nr:PD-(D/E)XK nuclease family protein [Oscillospiraceae bacterium]
MLNFILGGAGYGKSTFLIDKVNELASDKKIIFIVPEQFSFESDKKIYKKIGAEKFNNILSLSFTSLAKEIFQQFGGRSGVYAEDIHKFILMNKCIKELSATNAFTCFERQSKKISFVNEALSIVNEFRQCGITPEILENFSASDPESSEKLHDISMLFTEYDRKLTEAGLRDSLTDISEAAAVAAGNDYFKDCIIIIDEFESFTGDQYDMLDVMFSQAEDIYIALRLENPEQNDYGIFESVCRTWKSFHQLAKTYNIKINQTILEKPLKYKSPELAFINQNIMRGNKAVYDNAENLFVVQCRDLYEEADFTAAQIRNLVMNENYRYSDIAVISRQLDEYSGIFESTMKKYDIPIFMDIEKNAVHTRIMQFMINTVNIISEKSPSVETVLTFIKTALYDVPINKIADIENYCFEWDLNGKDFFSPFTAGLNENPEIENIRRELMDPVTELKNKCKNADVRTICRNLYSFLFDTQIPLRLSELNDEFIKAGYIEEAREQKRIWDTLMSVLETFEELGDDISCEEFAGLFNAACSSITFSVPPQTLDSVHIAKAETARLASPKIVFILGVNEGFFPLSSRKSGLLNEKDRKKFQSAGIRLSRSSEELASDEKLIVYKSLTHASEKLYILYPNCDNTGGDRFPSTVINQVNEMISNNIFSRAEDRDLIFYCSTPQAAYSNFVKHFGKDTKHIHEIESILRKNPEYSSRIDYLYEVSNQKDFRIENKDLVRQLYSDRLTISPTSFEDFRMCHFRFFCKTALKLRTLRRREIQGLEQGNIVHLCLERIISSCKTKQEFDALDEEKVNEMIDSCVEEYMFENMGGDFKKTPRLEITILNIKANILKIINHIQKELGQSLFRPVEFEFNIDNGNIPVIKADNGVEIILKGIIDRVDMYEEEGKKYIRVIDYKTGKKKFSVASLLYGINMQMILYLFSITGKSGKYNDCNPAGVLYMPSKDIPCDRDRDDNKPIDDYLNKIYKMNGVVLKERHVLSAMEKEIAGVYIPAKLLKADEGTGEPQLDVRMSTCFTSKEFDNLKKHTDKLLTDLAKELYDGKIEADPLVMGNLNPCDFCDYWSICGNMPCTKFHKASEDAENEMLEILSPQNDKSRTD